MYDYNKMTGEVKHTAKKKQWHKKTWKKQQRRGVSIKCRWNGESPPKNMTETKSGNKRTNTGG